MTSSVLRRAMTEAELQACIIEACGALGLPVFHIRDSRRSTGEGFPDLVIADTRAGTVRFWELKSERGRFRPMQLDWLHALGGCERVDVQVIQPERLDWALDALCGGTG